MKRQWIYHTPEYESDAYNTFLLKYAPWAGLRNFAYDLVSFIEPKTIVELGSHYGCSAFAFLQAVKNEALDTTFFAIDTWEGDSYTNYSELENVYERYMEINDSVFGNINSYALRKTFDEALQEFSNSSITILHIDGSHEYNDVRHDYNNWYEKVSDDGLILLHDIGADRVNGNIMGSHVFWNELKTREAYTLEIPFSCGLGIVVKNNNTFDVIKQAIDINHYQLEENLNQTIARETVRKLYFEVASGEKHIEGLKEQIQILSKHLSKYEEDSAHKSKYIAQLENVKKDADRVDAIEDENEELEKQINKYKETVEDKEKYISELEKQVNGLNEYAKNKDKYIEKLESDTESIKDFVKEKEAYITELINQIAELSSFAESKERYVSELKRDVDELNKLLDKKEAYIKELSDVIKTYEATVKEKDGYLKELEHDRAKLNDFVQEKEKYINELLQQRDELNEFAASKEKYIQELLGNILHTQETTVLEKMRKTNYSEKLLSIIIPVYNSEIYFDRCIKSVLNQSYKNIEIIVVNDGSKGNIRECIKDYLNEDKRVRYVDNKENIGLFRARISGAKEAHGDFIAFLDSDDYVSYDFYRSLIQKACETKSDITIGKTVWEQKDGYRYIYNFHDSCFSFDCIENDEIRDLYFRQEASCYSWHTVWNKVYDMKLWKKCETFFESIHEHIVMTEDILFSTVLFFNANRVSTVKNDAYFYCINEGASTNARNMTSERFEKNVSDISKVFEYAANYLADNSSDDDILTHFENAHRHYINIWKHYYENEFRTPEKNRIKTNIKAYLDSVPLQDSPSFYFESIQTEWNGGLEYIKEQIGKGIEQNISFDIFDTLIARNIYEPSDIAYLMQGTFSKLTGSTTEFAALRSAAELRAREEAGKKGKEDVNLHDIYDCLGKQYWINTNTICELEQLERKLEYDSAFTRRSGKELFDLAVYLGKHVYLISDMYLGSEDIEKILEKNGYSDYKKLFVSSDCGKLKASGNLYRQMMEETGSKPEEIIHIGDSWENDILAAQREGIKTFLLPKAREVYENLIQGINVNRCSSIGYELINGLVDIDSLTSNLGIRVMKAIVFNHYFDNPYRSFNKESDFNIDPHFIGYGVVGMHIAGLCKWIRQLNEENHYNTIHFCARDGLLIMKSLEILLENSSEPCANFNYLYASRKALMPVIIRTKQDFYRPPVEIRGQSPRSILKMLSFACSNYDEEYVKDFCNKEIGGFEKQFESREQFEIFIEWFLKNLYSEEKHTDSQKILTDYYKRVGTEDVVFDMGYSGRILDAISFSCGHSLKALYVHENYKSSSIFKEKGDIAIRDFYDFSPRVSGLLREEMLSETAGSCVGFNYTADGIVPIIEEEKKQYQEIHPVLLIQQGALDFIMDLRTAMDVCNMDVDYSSFLASIPFEGFLRQSSIKDRQIFSSSTFEDEVYGGVSRIKVLDYINDQLYKIDNNSKYGVITTERDTFMEIIHRSSKLKRALLYIITDKKMFQIKLKKNLKQLIN